MAHTMRVVLTDSGADHESPQDVLMYRAWRYPQPWPQDVTPSPEQVAVLDPGEEFLDVPELGVPRDPTRRPAPVKD